MRWRVDIGKQPAGVLTLFFYAWSLASCLQTPSPQLRMPEVVSVEESADYASVELTATLDHTGNVKQAGFYLWRDAGEKRHQEGTLAGNTLAVRWEGLEPKTDSAFDADVAFAKDCAKLTTLTLSSGAVGKTRKVANFAALKGHPSLEYVYAVDAEGIDFETVKSLPKLRTLNIRKGAFTEEQVAELKTAFPKLRLTER